MTHHPVLVSIAIIGTTLMAVRQKTGEIILVHVYITEIFLILFIITVICTGITFI
jgi:hypothetical protein